MVSFNMLSHAHNLQQRKKKKKKNNKNYAGGLAFESFFACTSLTEYLSL